jgi:hypothetical protein
MDKIRTIGKKFDIKIGWCNECNQNVYYTRDHEKNYKYLFTDEGYECNICKTKITDENLKNIEIENDDKKTEYNKDESLSNEIKKYNKILLYYTLYGKKEFLFPYKKEIKTIKIQDEKEGLVSIHVKEETTTNNKEKTDDIHKQHLNLLIDTLLSNHPNSKYIKLTGLLLEIGGRK